MFINKLFVKLSLLQTLLCAISLIACSDDGDKIGPVSQEYLELLKSHEWTVFTDDGKTTDILRFEDNGKCTRTYIDADGKADFSRVNSYTLKGSTLTLDYETYEIISVDQHKIVAELKGLYGGRRCFWDYTDAEYIQSQICGNWERYWESLETYSLLALNADGTYSISESYHHGDMRVKESGAYEIENSLIHRVGVEDGVQVDYYNQIQLMEDGRIRFAYEGSNGTTVLDPYTKITDGKGNPPSFNSDSKYYSTLTTGRWFKFDHFFSDYESYLFGNNSCTIGHYDNSGLKYESSSYYSVHDNLLDFEYHTWTIEESEDDITLLEDAYSEEARDHIFHFLSEEQFYRDYVVGSWSVLRNRYLYHYQFNEDGTYEWVVKDEGTYKNWSKGQISMDLNHITLTHDDYADKEEKEKNGHAWNPSTYVISLRYNKEADGISLNLYAFKGSQGEAFTCVDLIRDK